METEDLKVFFSKNFESDPYGAFFEHEHICLVPFIEEWILNKHFDETKINENLNPQELERNSFKPNTCYWLSKKQTLTVKSTLS